MSMFACFEKWLNKQIYIINQIFFKCVSEKSNESKFSKTHMCTYTININHLNDKSHAKIWNDDKDIEEHWTNICLLNMF